MKRLEEEEVKGPPELISSNPKEIGSSDDSEQVRLNYILSALKCNILIFRKKKKVANITWKN